MFVRTKSTFSLIIILYMLYKLIMQNESGPPSALRRRPCAALGVMLFLALLLPAIVAGWPLDVLEIRKIGPGAFGEGDAVYTVPVLLGREVRNTIIHSVQLTPVVDEYRVQEGRIWAWREKILSHNAGLPSLKPERGRFTYDPPWMIVEGTGAAWASFIYRVGTESLGKNELCVFPSPCRELWREMPGERLLFRVITSGG